MTLEDYQFVHPASPTDYRAGERIFDHRAVVYMRHGEPLYQFGGDTLALAVNATQRQGGGGNLSGGATMDRYDPVISRGSATLDGPRQHPAIARDRSRSSIATSPGCT